MRALRSRTLQSDSGSQGSGSNISDTENAIKEGKHNKKSIKISKKKPKDTTHISLQSQSTDTDVFTKSPMSTKQKTRKTKESITKSKKTTRNSTIVNVTKETVEKLDVFEKSPQHPKKNKKKNHRNERRTSEESLEFKNVTSTATKPKKTRNSNFRVYDEPQNTNFVVTETKKEYKSSRNSTKGTLKENISPNIKGVDVIEQHSRKNRKKSHRNEESLDHDFKNVVTSTAIKPIKTRNIRYSSISDKQAQNTTRLSNNTNFDVTGIKNESKTSGNKNTFEITRESQEYSPTFKNIVTSTTIKPKKRKQSIKKEKCNASSNILLENDIINISDTNKNDKNVTDVLNSTYLKIDDESPSIVSTSGEWKVEELKSIINISDETMFESNTKKVLFQDESLTKSARKKWQCYPRNSQGANSILEQISTPQKKSLPNKSLNISQKINKSTNKIKRTAMPNFALIHQKAYEKMESISEYSQRKKDRANLLLSNKKFQSVSKENQTSGIKSSRQLFVNEKSTNTSKMKFNRFGFKVKSPLMAKNKPPVKPSIKPSMYDKSEILAIANKKPQNTGMVRENKRDMLKGVRTNRRFELLMKMRNN